MALLTASPTGFLNNLKKQSSTSLAATQAGINPTNNVFSGTQSGAQGVQAKSPEQNIKPVQNTIQPNQAKPVSTLKTFTPEQSTGLMAALQRKNLGTASAEDTKNLNYAQTNGWKPTATNPVQSTTTTPTAPKTDISSTGIISSLVNNSNTGNQNVNTAQTGLLNTAQNNVATSGQAYKDYQTAITELADLKKNMASAEAGISSSGIPLEFQQGRSQVLNKQYADQLEAAQAKVNQAQSAINQEISGTQTQQAGYTQAASAGNTAQGLLQSGLGTAASYVQPTQLPYGTPLVTPQTGENVNITSTGVAETDPFYKTLQSYAQLLVNNQGSAIPSSITGNSVLNAQLIKMAQQINPNFNVNVSSGAGSAQTTVAGQQAAQIENWKSSLQQGQNLKAQFSDLVSNFGLNPANLNVANAGLQKIASNISDPNYQNLQNYISDIANTYAQILTPAGGSVTNQVRDISSSLLNSTMSGQGLLNVMNTLDQQANAKIAGVSTAGGLNSNSNNTSNNSGSGSIWSF